MKKLIRKLKKKWKNDKIGFLLPIVSILVLIVAKFTLGTIKTVALFVLLLFIYIIYIIIAAAKKKEKKKKVLKIILFVFLSAFILGIIAIIGFFSYIAISAPEFNEELLYVTEPSIILDKDENEVAKLGTEKRVKISYNEIPEILVDAIVATEDSRFFEHKGVDWARFLKASALQLLGRSDAGGASTLTMQVSKNAYTSTTDTGIEGIIRKFTDVYVSMFLIEKNYTKEQIMEFYVNSQWLGRGSYGVEQTSLMYFGKSAKELNLSEAAMMAGLFQAPGRYDPYKNPDLTEARRKLVLKLMLRHGYITKDEYNAALKLTVDKIIIPQEESIYVSGEVSKYQSFIDTVVEEVQEKTGKNPYTTSMTIYTTMNTEFQDYINDIMDGSSYDWENDTVQAGISVINVKDGSVAAIGGNRNTNAIDTFNFATDMKNQIGSTAKPLYDYGPAIEYMNWSPSKLIADEPITYSDGHSINNWDGTFEGLETLRVALKGSRNIPALKVFKSLDKSNIIEFVTNLGLTPEIYSCKEGYKLDGKECINKEDAKDIVPATQSNTLHEAHSIGGYNGESPLTMSAAYAAFSNGGTYTEPYTFTKLVYQDTNEEYINKIEKKENVMSKETAFIISDMLATTATQALGRYYNINGIKYAAKTGTTNYDTQTIQKYNLPYYAVHDLWTIGYNTEYSIGVWYGYDKISSEKFNNINSGQHLRIFQAVGKKVFTNSDYFTKPDGVVQVEIETECVEDCLPSEYTPSDKKTTDYFIKGTEPTTVSPRYAKLSDVSGLAASATDNKVTLSWTGVKTPEVNTEEYLNKYYSSVFENKSYLNSYINSRLAYISSSIGNIGYEIYVKDDSGNLKSLGFTTAATYEVTVDTPGEYTYVVKTAYSIFKSNKSEGKTVSVTTSFTSPIVPDNTDDSNSNI